MNIITLPLPNLSEDPKKEIPYIINEREYQFYFQWLTDYAIFDISLVDGNEIKYLIKGMPIVIGVDLAQSILNSRFWNGRLVLLDNKDAHREPNQENFHTDFSLYWVEQ